MGSSTRQKLGREVWGLATSQHGVVTRRQLLDLGLSAQAIQHRIAKGRLHRAERGVYAVGRPGLDRPGRWMAAVLACPSR
ncbi:MAG TPA: type IV toxin-antitoxin system AbiEi family antitoxin domain-containing protein [Solirubrobacterales bacterium]|nr:type IV toxin-antitoxin system AbiEi family antitoxin domain-containing protein [Solirubrobacterales bacterium]